MILFSAPVEDRDTMTGWIAEKMNEDAEKQKSLFGRKHLFY